jgi:hypothetical protein
MDLRCRRGQAFLGLILLIGSIVLTVSLLIAFLTSSFVDTGYGLAASTNAEAIATSGAEDALLKLDRNPDASYPYPSSGYSIPVGSSTATVYITQNSPSTGYITILSVATISNRTRKIDVVLSENQSTTQMSIVSWQEIQ